MERNVEVILEDILQSTDWILGDVDGVTEAQFFVDRPTRQAVERNFEIISEASRRVPQDFKDHYVQIPWRDIAAIGNILRHQYHDVRPRVLWRIVQYDLPALRTAVQAMLDGLKRGT